MTGMWLLLGIVQAYVLVADVFADHGFCSEADEDRPKEQMIAEAVQEIYDTCYSNQVAPFRVSALLDLCQDGKLQCRNIQRALSILPSCEACNNAQGTDKNNCYLNQIKATNCSINNYYLPQIKCAKAGNGKSCSQCSVTIDQSSITPFTAFHSFDSESTTNTDNFVRAVTDKYNYNGKKDTDCMPCDCPERQEQAGVSTGLAVGLLILGIIVGSIVTAVLCMCVPSLHSCRRRPHAEPRGKVVQNGSQLPRRDADQMTVDGTLPVHNTSSAGNRPMPTAPPVGSNHGRYHTLDSVAHQRDSHTYSGLQPSEYNEPMGSDVTYQDSKTQPIKGKNTVLSPVYLDLQNDIIIGGPGNANPAPHPMNNSSKAENKTHEYANESDTNYQRPVSDHQYFILEEQNGPQASLQEEKMDDEYHSYSVLEKAEK